MKVNVFGVLMNLAAICAVSSFGESIQSISQKVWNKKSCLSCLGDCAKFLRPFFWVHRLRNRIAMISTVLPLRLRQLVDNCESEEPTTI